MNSLFGNKHFNKANYVAFTPFDNGIRNYHCYKAYHHKTVAPIGSWFILVLNYAKIGLNRDLIVHYTDNANGN